MCPSTNFLDNRTTKFFFNSFQRNKRGKEQQNSLGLHNWYTDAKLQKPDSKEVSMLASIVASEMGDAEENVSFNVLQLKVSAM